MSTIKSKFSNSTYHDFIRCNPLHFNSMRSNPTLPQAIIENNIIQRRNCAHLWSSKKQEPKVYSKRCLFTKDKVHLVSLSSLTNQHLFNSNDGDYLRQILGARKRVKDSRNGLALKTLGDKSYRDVEYSNEFFSRSARDWRSNVEISTKTDSSINLPVKSNNLDYELNDEQLKQEEIQRVKNLDYWMPAAKLELPFKVLDLPDKSAKYRPKVTR